MAIIKYNSDDLRPSQTTTDAMKQIADLAEGQVRDAISRGETMTCIATDLKTAITACKARTPRDEFELSFYEKTLHIVEGLKKSANPGGKSD